MLVKVDTVATPIGTKDLIKALAIAWRNAYGVLIPKRSAAIIWAQYETETGGKDCFCFNLGNIKAADVPNETIKYCALSGVFEYVNGVKITLPATNSGSWFRAFDTLQEGVSFYMGFLQTHYGPAWQAVQTGDPTSFSHLLKVHGYYTAPEDLYTKNLVNLFNVFMNGPSYDLAIAEIQAADNATVPFPPDWQPVSLPSPMSKPSFFSSIWNKIKCCLK